MMNEAISTIMTTDLITVGPNDNLNVVRDIFMNKKIHHLPVVEGDKLVGLLTTYDLFKMNKSSTEYDSIKVSEVMTKRLATLEPQQKIGSAAELFLENLFHAVPIIKDGKLKGIITSFDVLKYNFRQAYPNQEI